MNTQTNPACFSFNALSAMRIISDVEFKLAGNETVLALGIKHSKLGCVAKIGELKIMIEDNYNMVADMIGCKLVEEIKSFK